MKLVADGHLTKEPNETVYSGVVSQRNLRLAMFLAELNNLQLWGADVGNAYLQALTKEKLYIVGGPEFEELQGHVLVMHKACYGTRSGGACWHHSTDEYVHPFDDYIKDNSASQRIDEVETEQTPVDTDEINIEDVEPVTARTRSHDSELIASCTRSQQDMTEIANFANLKTGSNVQEWLNEIAFIMSEMSDLSEPQTFQQAW